MVVDIEQARTEAEDAASGAEAAQAEAEAAQAEAEELNAALERKAAEFSVVMEEAADGDLTQRMATDSPTESMTEIARGFNEMIAELEATIRDVSEFAETVAAASQEVTASTTEIERASEQVTESTQVMSSGTVEQSERLEETAGEMSELSATIEEVAASTDQVAQTAQEHRGARAGRTGGRRPTPSTRWTPSIGGRMKRSNRWRIWPTKSTLVSAMSSNSSAPSRTRRTCSR